MKVGNANVLALRWMLLYFCLCTQPNQLVFSKSIGYYHGKFGRTPKAVLHPPKVLIQKPNYTFLEGRSAQLPCEIIRGNGTVTWQKDGKRIPVDVKILLGTPLLSYLHFDEMKSTHTGVYSCTVRNQKGKGSDSFQLTVFGETETNAFSQIETVTETPLPATPTPARPKDDSSVENFWIIIAVVFTTTAIVVLTVFMLAIYFRKFEDIARDEETSGESQNHEVLSLTGNSIEVDACNIPINVPRNLQRFYGMAEWTRPRNPTFVTTEVICHAVPEDQRVNQAVVEPPLERSQNLPCNAIQQEDDHQEQQIQPPNPTQSSSVMPVQQGGQMEPVINWTLKNRLKNQITKIVPLGTVHEEVEVWVSVVSTML